MRNKTHFTINTNNLDLKEFEGLSFSCHVEHCKAKDMSVKEYDMHLDKTHKLKRLVRYPFIFHQAKLYQAEKFIREKLRRKPNDI